VADVLKARLILSLKKAKERPKSLHTEKFDRENFDCSTHSDLRNRG
jgi:hypothetical protein